MSTLSPRPWYREPWPWFLMALPLSVVIASFVTIYLATRAPDSLVTDHYYKKGLAVAGDIHREQHAQAMHLDGVLSLAAGRIEVKFNQPIAEEHLRLMLRHPLSNLKDVQLDLHRTAAGVYSAFAPPLDAVRYRVHAETASWRLAGVWMPHSPATLEPGV
ncbi:MAG: FixH family protein [Novosphingobium sp.]